MALGPGVIGRDSHPGKFDRGWPRLQILTLAELFQGKRPAIPFVDPLVALRRARREQAERQGSLLWPMMVDAGPMDVFPFLSLFCSNAAALERVAPQQSAIEAKRDEIASEIAAADAALAAAAAATGEEKTRQETAARGHLNKAAETLAAARAALDSHLQAVRAIQ